jgi:Holliday junction resolvase RusA-like endonuclease
MYRAFARGNRVSSIKSKAYRDFIDAAGAELIEQCPGSVAGAYGVKIILQKGCRLDIDNSVKAWLDLLASHGVTDNDRNCQDLHVRRGSHDVTQIWVISTKGQGDDDETI